MGDPNSLRLSMANGLPPNDDQVSPLQWKREDHSAARALELERCVPGREDLFLPERRFGLTARF